jgi:cytochrome c-type biogenesis protein CcmH
MQPAPRTIPPAGTAIAPLRQVNATPARRLLRWLLLMTALLAFAGMLHAQAIEPMPFANHAQELRFQRLTAQLRCPMCQNQTLADSDAPIARDLRNQVFQLMQHGQTDAQIKHYLVERYSDFVLYDPPLQPGTWLLWFGPLAILLGGLGVVVFTVRKRHRAAAAAGSSSYQLPVDQRPIDNGDDW